MQNSDYELSCPPPPEKLDIQTANVVPLLQRG